ncbi:MAG: alkene reductase [Rhodospirillales bacterium]|nr:alkene reductase [Rhodospirillales bacterium]
MLFKSANIKKLGEVTSRIAMAPMTRNMAPGHTVSENRAEYYGCRAEDGIGLILTEGLIIHPSGDGYRDVPYLETSEQAQSWKPVLERVHAAKSKMFAQLWHCGRISHSDLTGGIQPVSSTNRAAEGLNRQNDKPFGTPRALRTDEMPTVYAQFVNAAKNALEAGFDGVEVHMGHGYLVDQFFDARINDRTDQYGGTPENRCRFGLELLEEMMKHVDRNRVMVRISPSRFMGEIYDWPDMEAMLDHLIPAFQSLGLGLLDLSCANANYFETADRVVRHVRPIWDGILIGGASLSKDQAEGEIKEGRLDLVTWGRFILANPDFKSRLESGQALREFNRDMLASLI